MSGEIGCIGLLLIAGFIGYLFYRRKKLFDDLKDFYTQGKYVRRETPPVDDPFVYKNLSFIVSSDGFLKEGIPYTLMLGTSYSGAGSSRIQNDFIGFYIPPQVQLSDEWLNTWKEKVAERGDGWATHSGIEQKKKSWGLFGPPQYLPIRAIRINDGVLLAWVGLHLRKVIEARIKDVVDSLK